MAGPSLTTASVLMCPHGGTVQIMSTFPRTKASGPPVVTTADVFLVVGCPFVIPATPPIPSPCLRVQWLVPDLRVKVNGATTLSLGSTGLCLNPAGLPQGPVMIVSSQPRVRSQ